VKPSAATVWPGNSPNGDPRHAVKLFIRPGVPEILALATGVRFMMLPLNLEVNNTAPRRQPFFCRPSVTYTACRPAPLTLP
jgi:hypothetical protein